MRGDLVKACGSLFDDRNRGDAKLKSEAARIQVWCARPSDRRRVRGRDHGGQALKGMWGMPRRQENGRGRLRKARGSCQTSVDPGIPE